MIVFGRNDTEQLALSIQSSKCLPTSLDFRVTKCFSYINEGVRVIKQGGNRMAMITNENNLMITLNDFKLNSKSNIVEKTNRASIDIPSHDISVLKNNVIDVAVGFSHCLFLTRQHEIFGFGNNSNCRLGISNDQIADAEASSISVTFKRLYNIRCYQLSLSHILDENEYVTNLHSLGQGTICKTNFHNLIVFGWNYRGELGTGNYLLIYYI